ILVAPSDESDAGCGANGRIGTGMSEFQALDRQTIHVRRCVVALAVTADIRVAEVIRHDKQNVRLGGLRRCGSTKARQSKTARGSCLHEPAAGQYYLKTRHVVYRFRTDMQRSRIRCWHNRR